MTPETFWLIVLIVGLVGSAISIQLASDPTTKLLGGLSGLINGIPLVSVLITEMILIPSGLAQEPLKLQAMSAIILVGLTANITSIASMRRIWILSKITGSQFKFDTNANIAFYEEQLEKCCYRNNGRRCDFYVNYREGSKEIMIPIKDLDEFAELLSKDADREVPSVCRKCERIQPKYTKAAHVKDTEEANWLPLCEECTENLLKRVLEDEDNYISQEMIVSRTV